MDDPGSDAATQPTLAVAGDGTGGVAERVDTSVEDSNAAPSSGSRRGRSGSDSSSDTPPPSATAATKGNQAEIEALQAENARLRLALEEAQAKLKAATNQGRSVRPVRSRSTSFASREPGNGGVAFAQMRRLLLKDERFLRDSFLPFLNMDDFGRCVGSSLSLYVVECTCALIVVGAHGGWYSNVEIIEIDSFLPRGAGRCASGPCAVCR